ncbi:MAG: Ig-like domain-containing protein [Saprospiraceae bacterium]
MKNFLLPGALLFCLFGQLSAQNVPTPTQTDEIIIDNGASGKADPADRIRYKVTIQNTGAANANGVQFNAVPDPRTTFVPGSFRSSPLAVPDAYTCTGNVGINVPPASGLKANDFDDNIAGATVTAGTFASTQGGSVVISSDGSFTYTPPAGFNGSDMFTYTLNDGNPVGAPVPTTDIGSVTVTVSDLIWFIDNSAAAGDGRLGSPFNSLAAFNAGSTAAAAVVYLEHTGTDYNGVITLQANERLFGEGHTGAANLSGVLPFSLAPNSKPLPNINGSRPVIVNSGGNGIALASNNAVRGVNVGNTTGIDIVGANFGTLTLSEVTLSGTGKALDLTTGTLSATFTSVTSTSSSTQGVYLNGVSGTANLGSTTISGCTTQGILVTGCTANITFGNTTITPGTDGVSLQNNSSGTRSFGTLSVTNGSGVGFLHANGGGLTTISGQTTITNPGGRGIDIQSAVASNGVTFANTTVTQSGGTGVYLNVNAGNITFADLDISPDANQRSLYALENSGTITTTDGAFTTTGNIGVEISKTSGATPLSIVLTSVSASGSSNGIILSRTSGSFTVNGTGGDGTGGVIQNMTARGASFFTATNITLKNMTFTNANTTDAGSGCTSSDNSGCNAAIYLNAVTNATLDNVDIGATTQNGINITETSGFHLLNSTLTNNGAGASSLEEGGIFALNLFGTASISGTNISFPSVRGAAIYNTNKTLTMTVDNSQFNDSQTSSLGADGFEMISYGNSVTDLDVTSCTFLRDKTNAVQFLTENTANCTVDISGCTVDPQAGVGVAFDLASNGTSTLKYHVFNNLNIKGRATTIINCLAQGSSTMEGKVAGNTVTSLGGSGSGIRAVVSGNANGKTIIQNNTVSGISADFGIVVQASGGTGRLDATISGNNVTVNTSATYNINVTAGASSSPFTNIVCANVTNNTVSPAPIGGSMIANFLARSATSSHQLLLEGSAGPLDLYWNNKGNMPQAPPANPAGTATVIAQGANVIYNMNVCNLPSYP